MAMVSILREGIHSRLEIVLTAGFLLVIHGVTDKRASTGFAPLTIRLALTLIQLISIPVANTSVNPARSTAVAIFQGSITTAMVILGNAGYWRHYWRFVVSLFTGKND